MKILYLCQHPGNILKCLVHVLTYHSLNDEICILSSGEFDVKQIKNIRVLPIIDIGSKIKDSINYLRMNESSFDFDKLNKALSQICDEILLSLDISIKKFDKIYVIFDIFNIWSIYLSNIKIHHSLIETYEGQFLKFKSKDSLISKLSPSSKVFIPLHNLCYELGIYTFTNEFINCVFFFSDLSKFKINHDVVIFDYNKSLPNIIAQYKFILREIFKVDNTLHVDYDAIFLTRSFDKTRDLLNKYRPANFYDYLEKHTNSNIFNSEYVVSLFYIKIIDYLFSNLSIVVKLHPLAKNLTKYFQNFNLLPTLVPVELILDSFNCIIDPLSTTATSFISSNNIQHYSLSGGFIKIYYNIDYLDFCLRVIKFLNSSKYSHIDNLCSKDFEIDNLTNYVNLRKPSLGLENLNCYFNDSPAQNCAYFFEKTPRNIDYILSHLDDSSIVLVNDNIDFTKDMHECYIILAIIKHFNSAGDLLKYEQCSLLTKDKNIFKILETCGFRWELPHSNEIITVIFSGQICNVNFYRLKNDFLRLENNFNILKHYYFKNKLLNISNLPNINCLQDYLDFLKFVINSQNDILVVISIDNFDRDTITPEIQNLIWSIGFTDFNYLSFGIFIGVIYNAFIVENKHNSLKSKQILMLNSNNVPNTRLKVSIDALTTNDYKSNVIINGLNYTQNICGINIFVYNVFTNMLIDYVCFKGDKCYRSL